MVEGHRTRAQKTFASRQNSLRKAWAAANGPTRPRTRRRTGTTARSKTTRTARSKTSGTARSKTSGTARSKTTRTARSRTSRTARTSSSKTGSASNRSKKDYKIVRIGDKDRKVYTSSRGAKYYKSKGERRYIK